MPNIVFRPAWRRNDPAIESDALAFWSRLNILPAQQDVSVRLKELCTAVYDGDNLVAVSTIVIRDVEFVRSRIAMFRGAVDPANRRQEVLKLLSRYSRRLLELWSFEHPEEKLMGMGSIAQNPNLANRDNKIAFPPDSRLSFVGFTKRNAPIRIAWFEHATLPGAEALAESNE